MAATATAFGGWQSMGTLVFFCCGCHPIFYNSWRGVGEGAAPLQMLWLSLRTMPPYLPPTFPCLPSNTSKDLLYQILPFTDRASFFLPDFLASLVPAFIASFLPFFLPSLPSLLCGFILFDAIFVRVMQLYVLFDANRFFLMPLPVSAGC